MGHTFVPDENNSLFGYKTDIIEQLNDGSPPSWIRSRKGGRGRTKPMSAGDIEATIEEGTKRARNRRDRVKQMNEKRADNPQYEPRDTTGITGSVERPIDTGRLPDDIQDTLSIQKEDAQEFTGFHHVSPGSYQVRIKISTQGTVKDIRLGRDFHH